MARRPRIVVPGTPHHITWRGNDRQTVFHSAADRQLYLDLLEHHAGISQVKILGYCLMSNHVHLIAIPEHYDSLAQALKGAHANTRSPRTARAGAPGICGRADSFPVPSTAHT